MTRKQLIRHLYNNRQRAGIYPREDLEAWSDNELMAAYHRMVNRLSDDYNRNRKRRRAG